MDSPMKTMAVRLGLVLIFLVALLHVTLSKEVRPGVQSRITQNGLNYARDLALDVLMDELEKLKIPDVNQTLGPASISVMNIQVSRFPRPHAVLEPIPGLGLHLAATGLSPYIQADFNLVVDLGLFDINDAGKVTVNGKNMSFDLQFYIGRNTSTGQPDIFILSCDPDGDITIGSEGGISGYINLANRLFKDNIRSLILAQICFQAKKLVNEQAASLLSTFPVRQNIFEDLELDYSLVKFPNFTQEYFDIFFKGAVYVSTNVEEPPFDPPIIPRYPDHVDKMVYAYVTNYLLNSGFYAAFESGLLSLEISPDSDLVQIPEELEPYLQTSCSFPDLCIGTIFSSISDEYPDSTVEVEVQATKAPVVNIQDAVFKVKAALDLTLYAVNSDGRHPLFTISVNVTSELTVHVKGTKVTFDIEDITTSIDVESDVIDSSLTEFFFETVAKIAVSQVLRPKLQEFGDKGFELPDIEGVRFVNPEIITSASTGDVLVIATDINYERPG